MLDPMALWATAEDEAGCAYILADCGVGRTCGAPRLIARRIMRCAMSPMAARPRPTTCAEWKRSPAPLVAAAAAKAAGLPDAS